MEKTIKTIIRVSPQEKQIVKDYADAMGITITELVKRSTDEYIKVIEWKKRRKKREK